ncbi:MAG: hypothetical protein UMU75_03615 [Halomonas sp.]|nr:hypothetical protein [Halomonas sp.]
MNPRKPVAYSLRFHEKQLIRANRFLGQPNLAWASIVIAVLAGVFWLGSDMAFSSFVKQHTAMLFTGWVGLYGLFKYLTPGRRRLKRIAQSEHRAEVTRVALAHNVGIQEVVLADSEAQRQQLEGHPVATSQKLA